MDEKRLPQIIQRTDTYWKKENWKDWNQDEQKAYFEPWKNAGYEKENERIHIAVDWVLKDIAIRYWMTAYIHACKFVLTLLW
jgi:hypothetical protein